MKNNKVINGIRPAETVRLFMAILAISPIFFVCLIGPWILVQLWVGPCCGVQPQAQGVGVFVTPLLHLKVL